VGWARPLTLGELPNAGHTRGVAAVDPDDDGVERYVVRRYSYDPERRERRHQAIAAFDNKREFRRLLNRLAGDLQRRRDAGEPVDPREHYTGLMLEPGYRHRQQEGRLLRDAIRHGATISDDLLAQLDLPSNTSLMRASYQRRARGA